MSPSATAKALETKKDRVDHLELLADDGHLQVWLPADPLALARKHAHAREVAPASLADHAAIRSLTARAFAGLAFSDGTEPRVIDALRRAHALALLLVAVVGEDVVGHLAFSEVGPAELGGWFVLVPVSVEPTRQRRGVGSELIHEGLRILRAQGAQGCVLVGDPRYYRRFGFTVAPALAPPEYPADHFQILAFGPSLPQVRIRFHQAYSIGAT